MAEEVVLRHERLILDACCVINLFASGCPDAILRALPVLPVIIVRTVSEEVLTVGRATDDEAQEPIDLSALVAAGLVMIVAIEEEAEADLFTTLTAARLDDGEAASAAVAVHRHWAIATDDGRARKQLARRAPAIQQLGTPELVSHWARRTNASADAVSACIRAIRLRGNYTIARAHPLRDWWNRHLDA